MTSEPWLPDPSCRLTMRLRRSSTPRATRRLRPRGTSTPTRRARRTSTTRPRARPRGRGRLSAPCVPRRRCRSPRPSRSPRRRRQRAPQPTRMLRWRRRFKHGRMVQQLTAAGQAEGGARRVLRDGRGQEHVCVRVGPAGGCVHATPHARITRRQDVTEEQFVAFMQKCGIVATDPLSGAVVPVMSA